MSLLSKYTIHKAIKSFLLISIIFNMFANESYIDQKMILCWNKNLHIRHISAK
ncbi:hypothetical protein XBKQ1_760010 [Xenorhabdus bovienii str. kraussei Quebec]|uniref:Uncharacterized protein n=1 Tax=Xenorhabdus bovienii str. kraussei Quebec TaxID=1398203 RepID=A0A077PMI3_XENBV|nr:hypothetical protein XBKQ1_760010 [Xenorhabdus bovienii str. kraussei Quebec]